MLKENQNVTNMPIITDKNVKKLKRLTGSKKKLQEGEQDQENDTHLKTGSPINTESESLDKENGSQSFEETLTQHAVVQAQVLENNNKTESGAQNGAQTVKSTSSHNDLGIITEASLSHIKLNEMSTVNQTGATSAEKNSQLHGARRLSQVSIHVDFEANKDLKPSRRNSINSHSDKAEESSLVHLRKSKSATLEILGNMGRTLTPSLSDGERKKFPNNARGTSFRMDENEYETYMEVSLFKIFYSFQEFGKDVVVKSKFLEHLEESGLRLDDIRLKETMKLIKQEGRYLSPEQFSKCVRPSLELILQALRGEFVIPDFISFKRGAKEIFEITKQNTKGKCANYIPQLARANPEQYGVGVCTISGQRLGIGDCKTNFCVQSVCKAINYCMAVEELGSDEVHKYVDRKASGRFFNALSLTAEGKPHNPMINAGAIMVCSLIKRSASAPERFKHVTSTWSRMAGGATTSFHNATYLSERQTADRNFALAYFMKDNNGFPPGTDLHDVLQFYFQCCSIQMNCETLSVVAATLANGGICPLTGERVLQYQAVQNCLNLLLTCGMYDYAGEFAFKIGLPAKSGVAGAIMIIIPNVMGICTWSPRLDKSGNSVRGIQFCDELCSRYNFHTYDSKNVAEGKSDPRTENNQFDSSVYDIYLSSAQGDLSQLKQIINQRKKDIHGKRVFENGFIKDYDFRTPLHLAACGGHCSVAKFLVQQNWIDHNARDRWGNSALDDAILNDHEDCIQVLKVLGCQSREDIHLKIEEKNNKK